MDIIDYLPQKMKAEAEAYMPCGLEEIRVRAGKQVQYMFAGGCRAGVYISHSDIEALNQLVSCGIRILGSVHGTNADDLRRKILPHAIERFVFIDHDEKGVRRYSIYDEAYRLLYSTVCGIGADKRLQQKKKGRYSDAV